MNSKLRILLVFVVLAVVFVSSITAALAVGVGATTATSVVLTCSSLSISGTSDAPYATIYAFNMTDSAEYSIVVPVSGGTYSGTISFPAVATGTQFNVEAWGTLDPNAAIGDLGYWDGGSLYNDYLACAPAVVVVTCPYPLPSDSVVYDVPAGAPAFYDADLNTKVSFDLPAGTWKISEFSGDFAKVWISCAAEPIWIPKNAVGAPVG